jgi:hypothetical protein
MIKQQHKLLKYHMLPVQVPGRSSNRRCCSRVTSDRAFGPARPDVRYTSNSDQILQSSEMSRRAINRHPHSQNCRPTHEPARTLVELTQNHFGQRNLFPGSKIIECFRVNRIASFGPSSKRHECVNEIVLIVFICRIARLMNLQGDQPRNVVLTPNFRCKDLLHYWMVDVRRRSQRFATEIADCGLDYLHNADLRIASDYGDSAPAPFT